MNGIFLNKGQTVVQAYSASNPNGPVSVLRLKPVKDSG